MKYKVTVRTSPGASSYQEFKRKSDALHFIGYLLQSSKAVTVTIERLS